MDIQSAKAELASIQLKMSNLVDGAKAAARDLTSAEVSEIEAGSDRAFQLKAAIRGLKNAATMAAIASGEEEEDMHGNITRAAKSVGFLSPEAIKSFTSAATSPQGLKALVEAGSSTTAVSLDPKPVELARPGADLSLVNVLPVTVRDSKTYSHLEQFLRDNKADVVAEGGLKPTSTFSIREVEHTLEVIAHLSEYVPNYVLADNSSLETFLQTELRTGLFAKVNSLAVDAFKSATDTQSQAFSTNIGDSLYLAASKSADLGYNPNAMLISRADFDALMLAKDSTGAYLYRTENDSRINGLAPIVVNGLAAKTAFVFDTSKVGLSIDRFGVLNKVDAISRINYNETRFLSEMRAAIDITAAPSIVKVATAGA